MKYLKTVLKRISLGIAAAFIALIAITTPVFAATNPKQTLCEGSGGIWDGAACDNDVGQPSVVQTFQNISGILLFVIGAIAVIMVIIGGIKYVTSNGEQAQVTSAKNTIMYAIIGIVVAFLAYAIVNFITFQLTK
jgi:hypothetical protein